MKFRITSKDLLIFVIFCLLLLYLCAIAVENFVSFAANGAFAGLNPFPAFTGDKLPVTLLLFLIFLVAIFASVSSYIFDKDKGKGIGLKIGEKENKGYSRWAKEKEIKEDKGVVKVDPTSSSVEAAGIPLINNGTNLWVDNGEYHNLIIGATGSGKSQTVVIPMVNLLAKHGESMIITDPKGELYENSAEYLKSRGYNIIVLNFRDPQKGNAWNPLTLPYRYYKEGNHDKATELLDDVALNILSDPNGKSDPFWEKSAADYFSGLALGLFEDAKEEEINLNSINYMSTVGEEKFPPSNFSKEYFTLKGEASSAYIFASNTINSPNETKGGILSVFRQKIRTFSSRENLSEMLSYSDFDIKRIGNEKTAVFIIVQDEKTTYHGLATIFIKQCYESLVDVAQTNGGKLPIRTNFILDEFPNMPQLRDVSSMVTAARSRLIRFTFIIQNFAQLKQVYGAEVAETIKGNCGNLIYLISTELSALEEISKMCGEVKSGDNDKTASTPLVTVTDLQKLKLFEAIIIRWRLSPFKTKYTPNFEMNWGIEAKKADYKERQTKKVELFNIKDFVKEKKRQKMLASLDGDGKNTSSNPFGGPNPFGTPNPFGNNTNPFDNKPNPFANNTNPFGNRSNPFENDLFKKDANPFGLNEPSKDNKGLFGGLNLDEMMRDIDRKIAELEAQEAAEKAKAEEARKKEEEKLNRVVEKPFKPEQKEEQKDIIKVPEQSEIFSNIVENIEKSNALKDHQKIDFNTKIPKTIEDKPFVMPNTEIPKIEEPLNIELRPSIEPIKEAKIEDKKDDSKAKVNVDADSIVVNNNITDDEFFDDFFGDD